jgi:MEDS: MEthanogen/methylotroph, DcmR Sensory domain
MRLARTLIETRCHVCAFFQRSNEEYSILIPFLKEGIDAGDKAVEILNASSRAEHVRRLSEAGVAVKRVLSRGQLELHVWEDRYLRDGRFDRHEMTELLQAIAMAGERRGTGVTRLWADMQWAAEESLDTRELLEYEAGLNQLLPKHDMATVCSYDVTRFRSSVVMDILRTHPLVIVGGVLRENPFYVEPDEFLRELSERTRWPDEGATVARSEIFALEEGLDYTVDEGRTAVVTEQGFERLIAAHRKGFEVAIMVDDRVTFALPAEVAPAAN